MKVKSRCDLTAEGHAFPPGTVFLAEAHHDHGVETYDLLHEATGVMLWAYASEVEEMKDVA